jgi:hypothetical protein
MRPIYNPLKKYYEAQPQNILILNERLG